MGRLALVYGLYVALTLRFWFVCDDAFITFRFARNWVSGRGLVFNPGEFPPVEGYSDFLWLLMAAACEAIGVPPWWVLPVVSAACGGWLIHRVWTVAERRLGLGADASFLGALALAASPAVGVWATSGLEALPFALLVWLGFEHLVLDRDDAHWAVPSLVALATALIRTEGLAWVAVLAGLGLLARRLDGAPLRPKLAQLARILAPVLLGYGMYTAWRFQYYGTLVPNTALVKVGFGPALLARGLRYVGLFWLTCLVPALCLPAAVSCVRRERDRGAWVAAVLLSFGFPAYCVLIGGDFMPYGRMLLPGLAPAALLLAGGLDPHLRDRPTLARLRALTAAMLVLSLLPAVDLYLVPRPIRAALHFRLSDPEYLSETNRWKNQKDNTAGFTRRGLALKTVGRPGDSVVAAAVGAIGYWSDLWIWDQHGLVTKEVAYRPMPDGPLQNSPGHDKHVEPEFFVKYAPRFLYGRAVEGKVAAGRMKDALDQWQVPPTLMDRYVPDWFEVPATVEGDRAFVFVVRRIEPGEDPAALWNGFPERRKQLNAELRESSRGRSDGPAGEG